MAFRAANMRKIMCAAGNVSASLNYYQWNFRCWLKLFVCYLLIETVYFVSRSIQFWAINLCKQYVEFFFFPRRSVCAIHRKQCRHWCLAPSKKKKKRKRNVFYFFNPYLDSSRVYHFSCQFFPGHAKSVWGTKNSKEQAYLLNRATRSFKQC